MSGTETLAAPYRLELDDVGTYEQYFLHSPTEIIFVLRAAMQKGIMMTVFFDAGHSFFLSSILAVEREGIVIDCGSHAQTNQRALKATRLACTLNVDQVKVQFALNSISACTFDGRSAFASALPERLLRLQRREYFRIPAPLLHAPRCEIDLPGSAGEMTRVEFPLVDLSAGGLSLRVPPAYGAHFGRDTLLDSCFLSLPENGTLRVCLSVCMAQEITLTSGQCFLRAGCEFINAPRSLPTTVQRYIIALERERKARLSGLE
ncbi:MAG: flagellar brake protein [Zoogloeaceae bacterium]|jgi:c-di-GMP-binding flagellar brake protein YcgR|nr:flagellar brake protein [Zoogloeaceae bacterium]